VGTTRLYGHLGLFQFCIVLRLALEDWGCNFVEFFAHEHVLLGYKTVDFDTIRFVPFLQLAMST